MKKYFPVWFKDLVKNKMVAFMSSPKPYFCPNCKNKIPHFDRLDDSYLKDLDKYQFIHSLFQFETLNIFNYYCPVCRSSDRNRLFAIYLEKRFSEKKTDGSIIKLLDIAPDKILANWIKNFYFVEYRSADLYMEGVDDIVDITCMSNYNSESFDIILCSHVLEHIVEDKKALAEIYRILKPDGFAIIMVPIMLTLAENLENSEWTAETDRWKYYGQNDHVRMYSKFGFINKLKETGFTVNQFDISYFGSGIFDKYGIHPRSVLYTVVK